MIKKFIHHHFYTILLITCGLALPLTSALLVKEDNYAEAQCRVPVGEIECFTQTAMGNNVGVYCPAGYQRTGCGAGFSNWNVDVPTNGNACHCSQHVKFGAGTCYARCCRILAK